MTAVFVRRSDIWVAAGHFIRHGHRQIVQAFRELLSH